MLLFSSGTHLRNLLRTSSIVFIIAFGTTFCPHLLQAQWNLAFTTDTTFIWPIEQLLDCGNHVLLATDGVAVYRSTDDGISWNAADSNFCCLDYYQHYYKPFSISNGIIYSITSSGINTSSDRGLHWKKLPGVGLDAYACLFTPHSLFAATSTGTEYSFDSGGHWTPKSGSGNVLASDGYLVYEGSDGDLTRWTDSGVVLPLSIANNVSITSIACINNNVFAVGPERILCRSTNRGRNWTQYRIPGYGLSDEASFLIADSTVLLFGQDNGIYFSGNDGRKWLQANENLGSSLVTSGEIIDSFYVIGTVEQTGIDSETFSIWRRPRSQFVWPYSLTVDRDSINFGAITNGLDSSATILMTNTSSLALQVDSLILKSTKAGYSISKLQFPVSLAAGASIRDTIDFHALKTGSSIDTLLILSDAKELSVQLFGDVKDKAGIASSSTAFQAVSYPNPFSERTTLFTAPGVSQIKILNTIGQTIATLKPQAVTDNETSFEWDASNFPDGLYYAITESFGRIAIYHLR